MARDDIQTWLTDILPSHERLTATVTSLIENILDKKEVEYLSVTGRTKSLPSTIEKISRKKYVNPKIQMTDITGIRIITYLEDQVQEINKILRDTFDIDESNSMDRAVTLGEDRMGYRSTHFVCALGKSRELLPEYEALGNLIFEVQVRTVLQHAWAELAHDRSFKFGPGLPSNIQRELNLYSGMLEIVDRAFDKISKEIDNYKGEIEKKAPAQITNLEINSISLRSFFRSIEKQYDIRITPVRISTEVLEELRSFGIKTIGDLERLTNKEILEEVKKEKVPENYISFPRTLMMNNDIDRYFDIWSNWAAIDSPSVQVLKKTYGDKRIDKILKKHNIEIMDAKEYARHLPKPQHEKT